MLPVIHFILLSIIAPIESCIAKHKATRPRAKNTTPRLILTNIVI